MQNSALARADVAPSIATPPRVLPVAVRLNTEGDIVASDGVGEVVLLPRLWDFDLLTAGDDPVLQTSHESRGMTAVLAIADGLAHVRYVSDTSELTDMVA